MGYRKKKKKKYESERIREQKALVFKKKRERKIVKVAMPSQKDAREGNLFEGVSTHMHIWINLYPIV
jgi:hypothetical protein